MLFTERQTATSPLLNLGPAEFHGTVSAETSVAEVLRRRILSGHLGVGTRLRQADIAVELGVSTTPVREALRTLMAEGLVEIDTHRGAVIRKLTDDELIEVLELQLLVEISTLRSAIPNMTESVLRDADYLHQQMCAAKNAMEWALLNRDFHLTLSAPSGKTRTLRVLRELLNVSTIQLRQDLEDWEGRRAEGEADHAALLEIARAGDPLQAAALLDKHTGAAIRNREESRRKGGAAHSGVS